jgi:hypothetical protein
MILYHGIEVNERGYGKKERANISNKKIGN